MILSVVNCVAFLIMAFVGDYEIAHKLNLDTNTMIIKVSLESINIGRLKEDLKTNIILTFA